MKNSLLALSLALLFLGCSAKEINNNVESITSDITDVFEKSKDNSSE